MANNMRFDLRGDKALIRALNALEDKVERRVLTSAVGKAARPILQSAKSKVPQKTRLLRNSLGIKRYRSKLFPMAIAVIGPRQRHVKNRKGETVAGFKVTKSVAARGVSDKADPAKYAHLVEFGTTPHVIPGAFVGGKGPLTVSHPGTPARPFLRPAFDQNVGRAQTVMAAEIWNGIRKEAAKHVR